jgi:hypothetical protein
MRVRKAQLLLLWLKKPPAFSLGGTGYFKYFGTEIAPPPGDKAKHTKIASRRDVWVPTSGTHGTVAIMT